MADIFHNFTITALPESIFKAVSTSEGLDNWWTKSSVSAPMPGGKYSLYFGNGYNWKAVVTKYIEFKTFELQFRESDADWRGTKVGFHLIPRKGVTEIQFYHTGWPRVNEHYKISSFCWAMYLRLLKRYIELGEHVAYEKRLQV